MTTPAEVLAFWFGERARPLWFEKDAAFDAEIRAGFGAAHRDAAAGRLAGWEKTPEGAILSIDEGLEAILPARCFHLLDQEPRPGSIIKAVIEAIDPAARRVVLRPPGGRG